MSNPTEDTLIELFDRLKAGGVDNDDWLSSEAQAASERSTLDALQAAAAQETRDEARGIVRDATLDERLK
ncbi:hypothetical protein COV82_06080 [Candidatus Peregrinibacteria bacterium CG11_big_fil_rev_8_21_14_0_20_46_8]|nr:MAG: hypothetical protein COV82_06080 [Candidatus Peregrinibacteria bacterium CG11_big_fil_rev_8_21_14_0_20_46_8]